MHEQRRLPEQPHSLADLAGSHLARLGVVKIVLQRERLARGSVQAGLISAYQAESDSGCLRRILKTSNALMLPEPSQIEFSGASRYRRGMIDSST